MLSAVTDKFKNILNPGSDVKDPRKRTLERDSDSVESEVGSEEPARKKGRLLDHTEGDERPLTRSSLWGISNFLSRVSTFFSTHMSSLVWSPTPPEESATEAVLTKMTKKHEGSRGNSQGADGINEAGGSRMCDWIDHKPAYSRMHPPTYMRSTKDDDIQYLGISEHRGLSDFPTKRPALSHHVMGQPSDYVISTNISSFRFSPTATSTSAKPSASMASRLQSREANKMKGPSAKKAAITISKIHSSINRGPGKNLHERFFGTIKKKKLTTTYLLGNGASSVNESFRYEEKLRYKHLLQQFTGSPMSTASAQKISSSFSSTTNSRSASPLPGVTKSRLTPSWTHEKRQELEESVRLSGRSPSFSANHLTPPASSSFTGPPSTSAQKISTPTEIPTIDITRSGSESSNRSARAESESDSVVITAEITRNQKRNSLEEQLLLSPIYSDDWLKSMREKYDLRAKTAESEAKEESETKKVLEERRKISQLKLEDRIAQRLRRLDLAFPSKIEEIPPEEEEEEEEELVPLTPEIEDVIDYALKRGSPSEVLVEKFNIQITRRDIATLSGLNWLNDEVINFYMNLLMERGKNDNYLSVYAFNTFFYPKLVNSGYQTIRRWTKKVDVFAHEVLLVPVHLGMHWCLASVDFRSKYVRYYDSMLGDNDRCLQALLQYLDAEHKDKKQSGFDTSDWRLENVKEIPQQMNGSDCGMFACKFAEYLSRDVPITFDQQHMPYFRQRMIFEIVKGALL